MLTSSPTKFVIRPLEVEGAPYRIGDNGQGIIDWLMDEILTKKLEVEGRFDETTGCIDQITIKPYDAEAFENYSLSFPNRNPIVLNPGDWLFKTAEGQLFKCAPEIVDKTYAPLEKEKESMGRKIKFSNEHTNSPYIPVVTDPGSDGPIIGKATWDKDAHIAVVEIEDPLLIELVDSFPLGPDMIAISFHGEAHEETFNLLEQYKAATREYRAAAPQNGEAEATITPHSYREKEKTIQAVEVTDSNMEAVAKWCGGMVIPADPEGNHLTQHIHLETKMAIWDAYAGNYIISDQYDYFYVVDSRFMREHYELSDPIERFVYGQNG